MNFSFPQYVKTPLQNLIPNASSEGINFLESLLSWDPANRPNTEQCFQHPFLDLNCRSATPALRIDYQSPPRLVKNTFSVDIAIPNLERSQNRSDSIGHKINENILENRLAPVNLNRPKANGENLRLAGASLFSRPIGSIGMGRHKF